MRRTIAIPKKGKIGKKKKTHTLYIKHALTKNIYYKKYINSNKSHNSKVEFSYDPT